jgi:two-component system, OmpR family, phosphate regulon sensor histidine kinase PhoR
MNDHKIRSRLMILTIAILLLSVLGSMAIANRAFTTTMRKSTFRDLKADALYIAGLLAGYPDSFDATAIQAFSAATEVRVTLIAEDGTVVFDSTYDINTLDNHRFRPEIVQAFETGEGSAERKSSTQEAPVLYHALLVDGNNTFNIIRLSTALSQLDTYSDTYQKLFFGGLAILLVFTVLVTIVCIRKITHPLEEIHSVVEQYTKGNLAARSTVESPQELADLSRTMNTMALQLQTQIADIEARRQQYSTILNSMTEGILYLDSQLTILDANHAAVLLLMGEDQSADILIQMRLMQLINSTELISACSRTLAGDKPQMLELARFGHLFGETAILVGRRKANSLRIAINPVVKESLVAGLVITINDITELKRLENIRKEFVANVSHELKTPITAIAGFSSTLLEGAMHDPEANQRFLHIINRQVILMQRIVEDLLLLSSLEQQNASPVKTWTSVSQIVDETLEACRFRADERESRIEVEIRNPQELEMLVNGMLIVQAVSNLVINAVTYSEPRSLVKLVVELDAGQVRLHVSDTGCGIPNDALERIFERFYRVDKARSRRRGGTGLGLSIVKHIVQVHGGTVSVVSEEGVGSTFTITLPRDGGELADMQKKSSQLFDRKILKGNL